MFKNRIRRNIKSHGSGRGIRRGQKQQFGNRPIKVCPVPPVEKSGDSFSRISMRGVAIVEDGTLNEDYEKAAWEFISFLCCDLG